jgi:protoheme IX farnesyltransferase
MASLSVQSLVPLYLELAKSRLSGLVTLTAAAGYVLGRGDQDLDWPGLFWTVLGTALCSAGANGLNQWWEKHRDARMERTCLRPIPSNRIGGLHALVWSCLTSFSGILVLWSCTNPLTALLGAMTVALYVLVYTPLKPRTSLCTLVGAVCGAIPPMMGWTGATGELSAGAWLLAATLFAWQIPHFLALAWLYRADYERGGFKMLPVVDQTGLLTCLSVILYCMALLPIGLALSLAGITSWVYAAGSLALGAMFLSMGLQLYRRRTDQEARRLFLASLAYLSLLVGLMFLDRTLPPLVIPATATVVDIR